MRGEQCDARRAFAGDACDGPGVWRRYNTPLDDYVDLSHGRTHIASAAAVEAGKWRWEPRDCAAFARTNRSAVCAITRHLGIRRLMFVGDSISYQMAISMYYLLGLGKDKPPSQWRIAVEPGPTVWRRFVSNIKGSPAPGARKARVFDLKVDCGRFKIAFQYLRNDHLNASSHATCEPEYCLPWLDAYARGNGPTLLLANTGAHAHSPKAFERDLDGFLRAVGPVARARKDLLILRSTPAGHRDCQNYSKPLNAPPPRTSLHDWDGFARHNAYLDRAVRDLAYAAVLDVVPMTRLRPDGHLRPPVDCLHHTNPGVSDYWNHLLVTKLARLAQSCGHGAGPRHRADGVK